MRTYFDWVAHQFMPAAGTLRDQSSWWVKAMRVADNERSLLENERQANLKGRK